VARRADEVRDRLAGRVRDFAAAQAAADPGFNAAVAFAQFAQDVCRVVVARGDSDAVRQWRARQDRFRLAIRTYLRGFHLKEEAATVGDHYTRWAGGYECVRFTPARPDPGRKHGEVVQIVAPRLVYEPKTFPLKGTLLYHSA
jgi:hypothetical protein